MFKFDFIVWAVLGVMALIALLFTLSDEHDKRKFINNLSDDEIDELYHYSMKNYTNKDFDEDKFNLIKSEYNKRKK